MKHEDRRTERRFFDVCQWREEEAYLQKRHGEGWRFVRISGLGRYTFERCAPEAVVYQLDYSPQRGEGYLQLFRDCGWEYIQDYAGYSYFRKPAAAMDGRREEIFCDDASRLAMLMRVLRGRVVPLIVLFLLVIVPQLTLQLRLDDPLGRVLAGFFAVMAAVYLFVFIRFARLLWRFRKSL